MKAINKTWHAAFAALLVLVSGPGASTVRADIEIRLSVKFILNADGTRPSGPPPESGNFDISASTGFDVEVAHGNEVLERAGRGYRLRVVEYLDIQPAAPAGNAADYWFNLAARSNRSTIEAQAADNTNPWRWNTGAINIYVNNSSSGQCSFVADGNSIALGGTIFTKGTVIHEIGHFFDLRHTHADDPDCSTFVAPSPANQANLQPLLADGDNLAETAPDHPCLTQDQLSLATFNAVYAGLTAQQQAVVNSAFNNVMSYHNENDFLDDQMDSWAGIANLPRIYASNGKTWFVTTTGANNNSGLFVGFPLATLPEALSRVETPNDVILLRTGTYGTGLVGDITKACTLRATRGPVTIVRP